MDIWACGGTMVILLAALYGVPQHLYEAAPMDGALEAGAGSRTSRCR